jgi:RNA polymerase sigma factor (sigma-70 family)
MDLLNLTDLEIWSSFKKGDEKALSFIYASNAEKLYRYGLKFTSESSLVEDSIQDLFLELIRNRKNLGETDNILYYLLKSFRRKLLRKLRMTTQFEHNKCIEVNNFDIVWSVEHDIIKGEDLKHKRRMLLKALNDLTPRQREAIYLRFSRELNYITIAGIMEISVEACRNIISKAIKSLKRSISGNGHNSLVLFQLIENISWG